MRIFILFLLIALPHSAHSQISLTSKGVGGPEGQAYSMMIQKLNQEKAVIQEQINILKEKTDKLTKLLDTVIDCNKRGFFYNTAFQQCASPYPECAPNQMLNFNGAQLECIDPHPQCGPEQALTSNGNNLACIDIGNGGQRIRLPSGRDYRGHGEGGGAAGGGGSAGL